MSKTIREIIFSYVSYVKILRKSLRKQIRTCKCSFKDSIFSNAASSHLVTYILLKQKVISHYSSKT